MRKGPVPTILVLAGCNGAGKSSVGGAGFLREGVPYFNPDEAARRIMAVNAGKVPPPTQEQVNAAAWDQGRRLLERAIREHLDFAFETTLGGRTMTELLEQAAASGMTVQVWYAGLASVELHLRRIKERVAQGGHDIPEAKVRERYQRSRENLIRLLPNLAELRLYDNSAPADLRKGVAPRPRLLLHVRAGRVVEPAHLGTLIASTPAWAKPIAAAALKLHVRTIRQ